MSSATTIDAEGTTKLLATLMAQLALKGQQVHALRTGGFLVTWSGYVRHCGDLEALEAFAVQVGAATAKD